MTVRQLSWRAAGAIALLTALYGYQRPFRVYSSIEPYDNIELPPDYQEKTEWAFARLMYPPTRMRASAAVLGGSADWREGGTSWSQDYPRADRHFAQAFAGSRACMSVRSSSR